MMQYFGRCLSGYLVKYFRKANIFIGEPLTSVSVPKPTIQQKVVGKEIEIGNSDDFGMSMSLSNENAPETLI